MGFPMRYLGAILIFILCIGLAHADFDIEAKAVDNIISLNETAIFNISIINHEEQESNFMVYSADVEWDLTTDPSEDRYKKVEDEETIRVLLKPTVDFWPNLYGVSVKVKSLATNEVKSEELLVRISGAPTELNAEYLPAVLAKIDVDESVDPREGLDVDVSLTNQNRLDIKRLSIVLRSALIDREYETSLQGLETKELDFNIPLDPLTAPQKNILNADIYVTINETRYSFKANSETYNIISYGEIAQTENHTSDFLKRENDVIL